MSRTNTQHATSDSIFPSSKLVHVPVCQTRSSHDASIQSVCMCQTRSAHACGAQSLHPCATHSYAAVQERVDHFVISLFIYSKEMLFHLLPQQANEGRLDLTSSLPARLISAHPMTREYGGCKLMMLPHGTRSTYAFPDACHAK